jgi:arylsulfatase A-like enzyme
MASEGLNFYNAISSTPVCAPYRASLITGKYSSSTGMVTNELRMNPNQETLAKALKKSGYELGYIGKWHLWSNTPGNHNSIKAAYIPLGKYRMGFDGYWAAYNFHHENYDSYYFKDKPKKIKYNKPYEPEAQFDLAMDFISRNAGGDNNPFALFLSIGVPHDPWHKNNVPKEFYDEFKDESFYLPETWKDSPDPYMDRNTDPERWLSYWKKNIPEQKRVYYAMVASIDEYMGRLFKKLKELNIDDNTIVVFTSDHGEMFGENGRVYKLTFYESAARVPFLIRWPAKIPAGLSTDALLGTPDIMPTILGLTGCKIPNGVEGIDMSHICLGKTGNQPAFAFLQGMGHTYLWKDGFEWRAVRTKRFTYAKYLKNGKELLFDNQNDPLQTKNLIGNEQYKKMYALLKKKMNDKMSQLHDEFKPMSWYKENWIDLNRNIISAAQGKF